MKMKPGGVFFARPSYGPAPDRQIDNAHLAAVMFAANHGLNWVGPVCPDREGWREARNHVVSEVLEFADDHEEIGPNGVVWVDDDLVVPPDAFFRLATSGYDFIGGLYFQRVAPYLPVAGKLDAHGKKIDFLWDYPRNVIFPVDGFGFGCCYTSMRVLKAVTALPESEEAGGPFSGQRAGISFGEDFLFCQRAIAAGFQPHLDTGIRCRHHLDSRYSDEELFLKFRGELLPPAGQEINGLKVVAEGEGRTSE